MWECAGFVLANSVMEGAIRGAIIGAVLGGVGALIYGLIKRKK